MIDDKMFYCYATRLLAIALQVDDVVEDVLTTIMMAKLMYSLRIRILAETENVNLETGEAVEYKFFKRG